MSTGLVHRLFGVVHFDDRPAARSKLEAMASALSPAPRKPGSLPPPRRAALCVEGSVGFGCLRTHGGGEDAMPFPVRHGATGILLTGDVQLYDREALRRSLALPPRPGSGIADGQLLIEAYLRWGDSFPARLRGDFALALWDPRRRALLFARDHLGCAPLFYARRGSTLAFASDLHGVLAAGEGTPALDPEWIASLLAGDPSDLEGTAYPGIRRALPGHLHSANLAGLQLRRYWELRPDAAASLNGDAAFEEAFRFRLDEAVRIRVPDDGSPVGAELSGGLDSSAVAAAAAAVLRAQGGALRTYTHVLPDPLLGRVWPHRDEREWARRLRQHAGIELHVPVSGEGYVIVDSIRRGVCLAGAPPQGGFSILPDALYDQAQAGGVGALFSGFGGDEAVSSQAALVPEGWIRQGDWRQLRREFVERGRPGANASRADLLRHWTRLRLAPWLSGVGQAQAPSRARADALLAQLPVSADYALRWALRERIANAGQAQALARQSTDPHALERMRLLDGNTAARLEAGNIAAGGRGIGYRYPLLDVPLIEFFHSVPAEQKWRLGWGRYLFRRSIAGWVPEELRWRRDKDIATIPSVLSRFRDSEAALRGLLSRARQRPALGFLDHDRLACWVEDALAAAAARSSLTPGEFFAGRLKTVLALVVHQELLDEGWRPGRPDARLLLEGEGLGIPGAAGNS